MSLNWAMLDPSSSSPIPLPGEEMILSLPGCELTLLIPDAPPPTSGAQAGGGVGGNGRKWVLAGRVWVSDHRVIFLPSPTPGKDLPYTSLSLPLSSIFSTSFHQPIFGSNHIALSILPTPGGGLERGTKAEVRFRDRGVFEFVKVLEAARERAVNRERESGEEGLPVYEPPPPSAGAASTSFASSSTGATGGGSTASPSAPGAGPSTSTTADGGHHEPEDAPPGYEL